MTGRLLLAALVLGSYVTLAALPASAHSGLSLGTPQPGATVDELSEITLLFTDPLDDDDDNEIFVVGPDGRRYDNNRTRLVTDTELKVGMLANLPAQGPYVVRFCIVSDDTDRQASAYEFTYDGVAVPTATPGPDQSLATGCQRAGYRANDDDDTATGNGMGVLWALAAVAGASALVYKVVGSRKRS